MWRNHALGAARLRHHAIEGFTRPEGGVLRVTDLWSLVLIEGKKGVGLPIVTTQAGVRLSIDLAMAPHLRSAITPLLLQA